MVRPVKWVKKLMGGGDSDEEDEDDKYDFDGPLITKGYGGNYPQSYNSYDPRAGPGLTTERKSHMARELKMEIEALRRNYRQINNDDEHERIQDALVILGRADERTLAELVADQPTDFDNVYKILNNGEIRSGEVQKHVGGEYMITLQVQTEGIMGGPNRAVKGPNPW